MELTARACHEMNALYCLAIGDNSQLHWEDTPDNIQESARDGVRKALEGATPEQLHQNWLDFKAADGWTYGEVKDLVKKTHPCFVPYEDLPPEQQAKDALFSETVRIVNETFDILDIISRT